MRMKRLGVALAAAALALTAAACGGGASEQGGGGGGGDQPYIAIVSKGFQHQFWQAVKQGAEQEAAKQNVRITFEGPATEAEIEAQVTMLTNALNRQPDVIGFAALDSRAAAPLLQQARSRQIPVVAFDSGVDSDIPVTTAATNNKAAAGEVAKHMAEAVGGSGKVALVVHDQTSRTGIDRRDGFLNRVKEKYPKINIVSVQYGSGDHLKSTEITKSILQANPRLKGIFGANEGSAIGVVNGAKEMNRKIVIIGYDSGKQQKQAIQEGLMAGAITQNPVGIGYKTVEAAVKALKGEKLDKVIDTGFFYYDKSNMSDPKIAPVLYD
jgi:ribose transport system substrate-binding protein